MSPNFDDNQPRSQRKEYTYAELDLPDLLECPFKQFEKWFCEAQDEAVSMPEAMSLATATKLGRPSLRTVLLKGFDEKGFLFYSNYKSRKGCELRENPFASLSFYWREQDRQIVIEGQVEKISKEESRSYFYTRPRKSQLAASVSEQSSLIENRKVLEAKVKELEVKIGTEADVPFPENWGGYRVWPVRVEFWQGRENRLNDRFVYHRTSAIDWTIERLQP